MNQPTLKIPCLESGRRHKSSLTWLVTLEILKAKSRPASALAALKWQQPQITERVESKRHAGFELRAPLPLW